MKTPLLHSRGSVLALVAWCVLPMCGQGLRPYEAVEPHMGTLVRIKLYAADEGRAQEAFRAAFARMNQLDEELSDYKPESELDRLSTAAVGHAVVVSDDLWRLAVASQRLSEETDGAFDITLGPLTHLWREARKTGRVPGAEEIAAARARCGYKKMKLDAGWHTIELGVAGMQLDVGAIAKGDAADQALAVLEKCGIKSALVAASGDLAFSEAPPGEAGWKIGVDSVDRASAPFTRVLVLKNAAVSTSGASEQHLDAGGVRYSHIVDPASGMGLRKELTVSVVARRGIDADSFSTAVSVLGVEKGLAFIEGQKGASVLMVTQQDGRRRVVESRGFGVVQ